MAEKLSVSSSRIAAILQSVREIEQPVHVVGTTSASSALLIARFLSEFPEIPSLTVLCPNDEIAADLAADIECVSQWILNQNATALLVPSWEQSPYSPIAPSIRSRLARLSSLNALLDPRTHTPRVVVTSVRAFCQATIPKELLQAHRILLKINESVGSREELSGRLVRAGYLRVDTVEDPGTFAVRGEIVDIFPPDREQPVRIELFDDVVEKMREFDPQSQRTAKVELGSALAVSPAREVLVNPDTIPLIRERLKERADDLGISRSVRDPLISLLQDGGYPDHSDAWAPFAYREPATLLDYVDGSPIIWVDELSCQQEWDQFHQEQKRLEKEAPSSGLIIPPVSELFRWSEDLDRLLRDRTRLFIDRVGLANLEQVSAEQAGESGDASAAASPGDQPRDVVTKNHRVSVKNNQDLIQGSRQALGELESKFKLWMKQGFKILGLASTKSQVERMRFLIQERGFACRLEKPLLEGVIVLGEGSISEGFRWPAEGLVVLTEDEILGSRRAKTRSGSAKRGSRARSGSAARDWAGLQALADLSPGDTVVHVDHGIGRYQGLVRLDLSGAPSDFLLLEYAGKDKLYLPVYRLNVIQKYSGAGESVALDKLGTAQFAKAKEKVRESVKKLAFDLVKLYAERQIRPGVAFSPRDSELREFEAKFPFDETPDQLKAVEDILTDVESGRVMDRIVCGDVGYGKTEVAMRAAFKAVSDGKQVAVLVPTTVLAFQHEQNFKNRFKDYPITIDSVSRFKTTKEQKATLEALEKGRVDIVIGTHRLLSRDVRFSDLGLVIVDEEHRFGVEHKEKLKTLKINTHVLTLTATPIPRTLHMALSGLRDISLINTPPVDRLPIRTYVSKFDEALIQRAIQFELGRGGQVFFLHNRVQTIYEIANKIRELVPNASVGVGHGQMAEGELEKTMLEFYEKRYNVLVSTTIIESGLDVPSANTIVVNRADTLGLAQLYQIRGRVGRGQQRAYAYLLIPAEGAVTEDAKKRLEVIQKFVELGSGFSIASHDLELRGGGDLLGPQQSGNINAVGFELYTELLEEAIRELQGKPLEPEEQQREPEIKAPFPAFLSEQYVPDVHQRLSLYRRLSASRDEATLTSLEEELKDRFGDLPDEAQNLLWLIRLKQLLKGIGVDVLTVGPEKISLLPGPRSRLDPAKAIALVSGNPSKFQLTPDSKLVAKVPTGNLRDLYFGMEKLFGSLVVAH